MQELTQLLANMATYNDGADSSRWMTFDKIAERTHSEMTYEELPALLANLTDYGSIDRMGSNYRVHMPLLERWLRETQF
jgi:hypothetical protein